TTGHTTLVCARMLFLIEALIILVFPAWAVRAWRRRGARGLALLTAGALGLITLATLVLASGAAGNRIAASDGYAAALRRVLPVVTLAGAAPVLAVAAAVPAAGKRVHPRLLYAVAVTAALVAVVLGALVGRYATA
ncbi:MAG TPA: hypothetical protein VIL18_11985, partial [Longimicrobiales bacterium]